MLTKTKRTALWGILGGVVSLSLLLQNLRAHGINLVHPATITQWGYDTGRVLILVLIAFVILGISILLFRLTRSRP